MGLHTVQFVGKEQTLHAFDKTDVINWSFWQGKQMIFAYEGSDEAESRQELEEWIKIMSRGSNAIYTIKFYKGWAGGDITQSTRESVSFNFRLNTETMENPNGIGTVGGYVGANAELVQAIGTLKSDFAEFKKKMESGGKEEKLETWEKLLEHPIVIGGLAKVLGIDMSAVNEMAKVAGVPAEGAPGNVDDALDFLEKEDPKFDEHMVKLAKLAKTNKVLFNQVVGALDKM